MRERKWNRGKVREKIRHCAGEGERGREGRERQRKRERGREREQGGIAWPLG